MSDLTKSERIKIIVQTFRSCGEEPTAEQIAIQYKRETGEDLPIEKELPWAK